MANLVPENYVVKEDNMGLLGLYKSGKNGQEKLVMPHFFVKINVAKCYNRIIISYMTAGDNFITLRNYNNTCNTSGLNICDIKFGSQCIYALIYSEEHDNYFWWLLDKELKPVKNVGYFEFGAEWCDGIYFKVEKESIVVIVDGHQKKLMLKTGNIEDVYIYKRREEKVLAPVNSYDFYFDLVKNAIGAKADNSKVCIEVNGIADLERYLPVFQLLLGNEIVRAGNNMALVHDIPKAVADGFINLIKQFEFMGDIAVLTVLINIFKSKCNNNIELIHMISKELKSSVSIYTTDKGQDYKGIVYIAGKLVITVVRNSNGRLTSNIQELKPEWLSEDTAVKILEAYKITGKNVCKVLIDGSSVVALQCDNSVRLPIPASIKRRKSVLKEMNTRETYYDDVIRCECKGDIVDANGNVVSRGYGLNINLALNLCYIPKKKQGKVNICSHVKSNAIYTFLS